MKLGLIFICSIFYTGTLFADWEKLTPQGKVAYVNRSASSRIADIIMNAQNAFTVSFRDRNLFNQFGAAVLLRTRGNGAQEIIDTIRMMVVVVEGNAPIIPMLTRLREMELNLPADILQMTAVEAANRAQTWASLFPGMGLGGSRQ